MSSNIIKMYRDDKTIIVDGDNEDSVQGFLDIGFSLKPAEVVEEVSVPEVEPVPVLKPKRGKRTK